MLEICPLAWQGKLFVHKEVSHGRYSATMPSRGLLKEASVCRGLMTTVPGRNWAGPGSYRKQAHQTWETKPFSCCNFSLVPSIYYLVPKIYYCTSRQRKNIERAHNHFHKAGKKKKKKKVNLELRMDRLKIGIPMLTHC